VTSLAAQYGFGTEGSARPYLQTGWSNLEPDFNWTEGHEARLRLPVPPDAGTLMLEIGLAPLIAPPVLRRQRLILSVNDTQIAELTVGAEGRLGFEIPASVQDGAADLRIVLHCPDAVTPADLGQSGDPRLLGFAVTDIMLFHTAERQAFVPRARSALPVAAGGPAASVQGLTGLTIPALAECFESLGHNCEFGLVQRAMGAETLGLLRFAGIAPHKLAEGLDLEFDGIDAPGNLATYVNEPSSEFMVRDRQYGTIFHSDRFTEHMTQDAVLALFYRSLGFLRRKLSEDLRDGGKIFVFQHPEARSTAHVLPLLNLLRSFGPNTLLFVTEGGAQQAGCVTQLAPDLLHGQVAQLAPSYEATRADVASWVQVCANAYRLWRESAAERGQA
jgi:hypothetical protein